MDWLLPLFLLTLSQLAGAFLGVIENNRDSAVTAVESFLNVLGGSISGLGLAIVYCIIGIAVVLGVMATITVIAFTNGLILIPLIGAVLLIRRATKRHRRKLRTALQTTTIQLAANNQTAALHARQFRFEFEFVLDT